MTNTIEKALAIANLPEDKALAIKAQFEEFRVITEGWGEKAMAIVVTDESQTAEMKVAHTSRMFLRAERGKLEKVRILLKKNIVSEGKAIDAIARELKGMIEPLEAHLQLQEDFVKIKEKARLDDLEAERRAIIMGLGSDPSLFMLRLMPEDTFQALVESTQEANRLKKEAAEAEAKAAEKAEADRLATEAKNAEAHRVAEEKNKQLLQEAKERQDELDRLNKLKIKAEENAAEEKRLKENALRVAARAKETKAVAVAEKKAAVLSASEQLEEARRVITNIHQSTKDTCAGCLLIRQIAEAGINKIGGWLE